MIILSFLSIIFPYKLSYSSYDSIELMQEMDITGFTKIFLLGFLIINTCILLICIYEGLKGTKNG